MIKTKRKFIGYTVGYPDGQNDDKIGEEIFDTKKEADKFRASLDKMSKWEREHEGAENAVIYKVYAEI